MKVILNPWGEKVEMPNKVIAWQNPNTEIEIVYQQNPEEIKILIEVLKKESKEFIDNARGNILEESYWMKIPCSKNAEGKCAGDCGLSSCTSICGLHSCYCGCKS